MKREQEVVVSDASELLFEDIKKLNAQQRPDVPTCLIYAPIRLLPMSTKHQHISTFYTRTHTQTHNPPWKSEWFPLCAECVSVIWNCGTICEHSWFGCSWSLTRWKLSSSVCARWWMLKHAAHWCVFVCVCVFCSFQQLHSPCILYKSISRPKYWHICIYVLAYARVSTHATYSKHDLCLCQSCWVKSSTVYRLDFAPKRHRQQEEILKQKSVQFN